MSVNIQVLFVIIGITWFCTENSGSVSIGGSPQKWSHGHYAPRFNSLYMFSFFENAILV